MSIRVVRLGSPRAADEGLRIGTVRRPPRGVRREEYATLDFFDVWLPELAPSAPLVSYAFAEPWSLGRWAEYEKRYRSEIAKPSAQRLVRVLAALSKQTSFSIGCYCENANYCHRAILKDILEEAGAEIVEATQQNPVERR